MKEIDKLEVVKAYEEVDFGEIVLVDTIAHRVTTSDRRVYWAATPDTPRTYYYCGYTYKRVGRTVVDSSDYPLSDSKFIAEEDILLIRLKLNLRSNDIFAFPSDVHRMGSTAMIERIYDNSDRVVKLVWSDGSLI